MVLRISLLCSMSVLNETAVKLDEFGNPTKQTGVIRGGESSYALSPMLSVLVSCRCQRLSVLPKVAARARRRTCERSSFVLEKRAS